MAAVVRRKRNLWLYPIIGLVGLAAASFVILYIADHMVSPDREGFFSPFRRFDRETVQNGLANVAAIVAAVMGIVITVVSIIVQLSATRYSPQVTEMFFKDKTNLLVMAFYVEACTLGLWVTFLTTHDYVPQVSILTLLIVATIGFLIMAPYFAYVFGFLSPDNVVSRIQNVGLTSADKGASTEDAESRDEYQSGMLSSMEQLTDICHTAIQGKDKLIAVDCVDALKKMAVSYLVTKKQARAEWFGLGPKIRANPDFVSMTEESARDLQERRVWVEWKILRQYQSMYMEALAGMKDLNYVLAIDTRYIGEAAIRENDPEALRLAVKFFNTYLRATLNARDIRTAYNILNQYRMLVEALLRSKKDELALEVVGYLKYYGHIGFTMKLPFVTEVVAYDIAAILEVAHDVHSTAEPRILLELLQVDRESTEGDVQETSLRGVRKAQAKLATFYLLRGAEAMAREIYRDMEHERPERLRSIRDELLKVDSPDFWEVNDRWVNFDYVPPDRRKLLHEFFGWFEALGLARTSPSGQSIAVAAPPVDAATAKGVT